MSSCTLTHNMAAQQFSGRWILDPDPSVQNGLSLATVLRYEVSIVPKWSLPSTIITTIVRCGLPANVRAIATRAEQVRGHFLLAIAMYPMAGQAGQAFFVPAQLAMHAHDA